MYFPEGTSLSALEVAACKKPVIMTDYLASRNRSKLGIGLTYKTGNINDLKTILKLIKNKKFYNKVCDNSYKAINKHYTYEYISKIFITLCMAILTPKIDFDEKLMQKKKIIIDCR